MTTKALSIKGRGISAQSCQMVAVQLLPVPSSVVVIELLRVAWDRDGVRLYNTCVVCVQAGSLGRAASQARAGRPIGLVTCCVELKQSTSVFLGFQDADMWSRVGTA